MGSNLEFNWYVVYNCEKNDAEDLLRTTKPTPTEFFVISKRDYRIYPMHEPLPFIMNNKCYGLVAVDELSWEKDTPGGNETTWLKLNWISIWDPENLIAIHSLSIYHKIKHGIL